MIIVKLQGGLGNQLFHYAFARGVSHKLKTDFRLDPTPFHTYYKLHKYSLHHFNVKENPAKGSDLFWFVWIRKHEKIFSLILRKVFRKNSRYIPLYHFENKFPFDPSVFKMDNTYFDGYWNTEKYFAHIGPELRQEISIKTPLSQYSQNVSDEISDTNAVSIHVRRADYVSNKKIEATFGLCSPEYYQSAIEYIAKRFPSPHFFIFSDDFGWASEHFKSLPYPTTCVNNSAEKNYEDITLMSQCKHNIIANSTFSWWGAWLNKNPNKIVIAPKNWFASKNIDTSDVVPSSWVKM
jgi:hypothetical protein